MYANATAKGEHYIPGSWDIFYEKFGFMLVDFVLSPAQLRQCDFILLLVCAQAFWNLAGVPFLYCAQGEHDFANTCPHLVGADLTHVRLSLCVAMVFSQPCSSTSRSPRWAGRTRRCCWCRCSPPTMCGTRASPPRTTSALRPRARPSSTASSSRACPDASCTTPRSSPPSTDTRSSLTVRAACD